MVSRKSCRLQEIRVQAGHDNYPWRFTNKSRNLRQGAVWHPAAFHVPEGRRLWVTGMLQQAFRSASDTMLQTIQTNCPAGKVFSLYCVWTTRDGSPNSPLVAIWIDPSMSGFEGEIALAADSDCAELNADEPGGCVCARVIPGPGKLSKLESLQR